MTNKLKTPSRKASRHEAAPLVDKIMRMSAQDLEPILATLGMTEDNKRRVREYLVEGQSMPDIAARDGVSRELVSSAVRRTRARINQLINPRAQITVSLTLPLQLAEELRSLCDGLARLEDSDLVDSILKDVRRSVAAAKVKVLYDT